MIIPPFVTCPDFDRVYHVDALTLMAALPDESIDLVVTSPPYNLRNSSGGFWAGKASGKWDNAVLHDGYDGYDDNLPYPEYVDWQRDCLSQMMRVIKPDGAIFYNHKKRVQNGLLQDRSEILQGFPVRQEIIWQRDSGLNFNSSYFVPTYETIFLIAKPDFRLVKGANGHGDIWKISPARNNPHPAPFPIEIPHRIISSTNAGVILDPFAGSGTTLIAAKILGRRWLGCDISIQYVELARKRLEGYSMVVPAEQLTLL